MRLVRLDDVAPGGRDLDLHPRLTVLVGAPAVTTELVRRAFRSLVDGQAPPVTGWLEAHGVQLALTRESLITIGLGPDLPLDPVLEVAEAQLPPRPAPDAPTGGPRVEMLSTTPAVPPASVAGPAAGDPARLTREAATRDLEQLRLELRSVTGELTVLGRRMDEARSGLDSFARADLTGARERVEALNGRVQQAVADHEAWVSAASGHRADLRARRAELLAEHDRVASIDPETVSDAADRLASVLDPPRVQDPAAAGLADRIDEVLDADEDRQARREAAEGLLGEAEARLADAWAELREVLGQERTASTDPEVVRQLERVRDEIYELEERGGRIAAVRSRRRIDELRAEEAELLDRLGFDTYSSFVMGVPTARAEAERAMRIDAAQARIDTLQRDVDRLRADSPGGEEEQRIRIERAAITDEAARLLGADPQALGRLTSVELGELLRSTHLPTPPETSAEVLSAAGRLAAALSAAGEEPPSTAIDPTAMLEDARRWLAGMEARHDLLGSLVARVDEVDRELARLDRDRPVGDDGGRLADMRAELVAADERVVAAERRLEAHLSAMGDLADLRTEELELRERQRALESSIDERERVLAVVESTVESTVSPPPFSGPIPAVAPVVAPGVPPSVGSAVTGAEGVPAEGSLLAPSAPPPGVFGPVSREWRVLSRLADLRRVGMVGSVPLLVSGLTSESTDTEAVLHRLEVMSDLVQVVVTTDDERVAAWADRLGGTAAVVRW